MKPYEHLCVTATMGVGVGGSVETVNGRMQALGTEGWELVGVCQGRGTAEVMLFFKREGGGIEAQRQQAQRHKGNRH